MKSLLDPGLALEAGTAQGRKRPALEVQGHDLAAPLRVVRQGQVADAAVAVLRGEEEVRDLVKLQGNAAFAFDAQAEVGQSIERPHGGQ